MDQRLTHGPANAQATERAAAPAHTRCPRPATLARPSWRHCTAHVPCAPRARWQWYAASPFPWPSRLRAATERAPRPSPHRRAQSKGCASQTYNDDLYSRMREFSDRLQAGRSPSCARRRRGAAVGAEGSRAVRPARRRGALGRQPGQDAAPALAPSGFARRAGRPRGGGRRPPLSPPGAPLRRWCVLAATRWRRGRRPPPREAQTLLRLGRLRRQRCSRAARAAAAAARPRRLRLWARLEGDGRAHRKRRPGGARYGRAAGAAWPWGKQGVAHEGRRAHCTPPCLWAR